MAGPSRGTPQPPQTPSAALTTDDTAPPGVSPREARPAKRARAESECMPYLRSTGSDVRTAVVRVESRATAESCSCSCDAAASGPSDASKNSASIIAAASLPDKTASATFPSCSECKRRKVSLVVRASQSLSGAPCARATFSQLTADLGTSAIPVCTTIPLHAR